MLQRKLLLKNQQAKQQNNEIHHSINKKGKLAIVYPFFLEANPAFRFNLLQSNLFLQVVAGTSFGRSATPAKNSLYNKRISASIRAHYRFLLFYYVHNFLNLNYLNILMVQKK
jgi:hypothetical protein